MYPDTETNKKLEKPRTRKLIDRREVDRSLSDVKDKFTRQK